VYSHVITDSILTINTIHLVLEFRFSSRRSSEVSQNSARLSIINSPYEYDILGNLPDCNTTEVRHCCTLYIYLLYPIFYSLCFIF